MTFTGQSSRPSASVALALSCAVLLAGCGDNGPGYTSGGAAPSYSVGGSITGLTTAGLVLANGTATVAPAANAASFTFPTAVTSGTSYSVTVKTQPGGGVICVVSNGSGQVSTTAVTGITVACGREWTWMSGANTPNAAGVYGTLNMAAAANVPGARHGGVSWTDSSGNFWMFAGFGNDSTGAVGYLGDLWEYNPGNGQWTWMSGANTRNPNGVYGTLGTAAAANVPGARGSAVSWTDGSGNLWVFGGFGFAATAGFESLLNDLWKFNVGSGQWTWVSGSNSLNAIPVYGTQGTAAAANVPGAREEAASWIDPTGNLWLFGGSGYDSAQNVGSLNDLWKYNATSGQWTWVSGSNVGGASGVYGTLGTAAAGNVPGARVGALTWTDSAGDLWLFGGVGNDKSGFGGFLSDLWKFSPGTGMWTWVSGPDTSGLAGVYGTLGVSAATNIPGGREFAVSWTDQAGNLWFFGGSGLDTDGTQGLLGDLWEFNPGTSQWTWSSGPNTANAVGVFGTQGVAAAGNSPDARSGAVGWIDSGGALWLFGGTALYSSPASTAPMNDLWRF